MNMDKQVWNMKRGAAVLLTALFCVPGTLTACGQETEEEDWGLRAIPIASDENPAVDSVGGAAGVSAASEDDGANDPGETISDQGDFEKEGLRRPGRTARLRGQARPDILTQLPRKWMPCRRCLA